MSFFSKVFGGKKEPAAPSTAEAIQKLRETEDMLIKKQEFLESKIDNEILVAKKNASKNKRGTIQLFPRFASRLSNIRIRFYSRFFIVDHRDNLHSFRCRFIHDPILCRINVVRIRRSCTFFTLVIIRSICHSFLFHLLTTAVQQFPWTLRIPFYILAAIQALKRKKRYEKQLQQIDGTLSTIEMQREALESANTNTAVLTTMKGAADAMKAAHQHM